MKPKAFYLLPSVTGTILPCSFFVQFLREHGLNLGLFVEQLFANSISSFFATVVIVSAICLWLFVYFEGHRARVKNLWAPVVASLVVGVSLGLPLFLYLREFAGDQCSPRLFESKLCEVIESALLSRINRHAREWGVLVEERFETATSMIAFGKRDDQPVVLKVVKQPGDEWHSGETMEAFQGSGVVRVYDYAPGVMLMERLVPGNSLVEITADGRDEEATETIADVIRRMIATELSSSALEQRKAWPAVEDWGKGFDRYLASRDDQIPISLIKTAQPVYARLCGSQHAPRLLHGDLQHYNVLFDSDRGWLAIDPKGVIGEVEYEIGATLRNPIEQPELFLSPSVVKRRLKQFTSSLHLDYERALSWAFAQAVLSAIWQVEDGIEVNANNPALKLANIIQQIG
jgi:streptomycin 6-kinase